MLNFLDKRKKRKLYQQWANTSGLPQEEIPNEIQDSEPYAAEKIGTADEELQDVRYIEGSYVRLRLRYLLYIVFILVLLIIMTSVLSTVLIMKSC